jgi:hypothetical protein
MIGSYYIRLCAILALKGQCLHGHCDVMRDLRRGRQTPDGISHAREAQAESLQGFVEVSRELLAALLSGDQLRGDGEWIAESVALRQVVLPETHELPRMTPAHWKLRRESASSTPIISHTIPRSSCESPFCQMVLPILP